MRVFTILATSMLLLASTVDHVELFKFRKQVAAQASASSQPIPPPPPPPPPAAQQQLVEVEDTRMLAPLLFAPSAPSLAPPAPIFNHEYHRLQQSSGIKGDLEASKQLPGYQPLPPPPAAPTQQHHAMAYLVVKPFSKFQNYYDPSLAAYYGRPQAPAPTPVMRPFEFQPQQAAPARPEVKGVIVKQPEPQPQIEQQQQLIEQHEDETKRAPAGQSPPQAIVVPIHADKESKLRTLIDRIMSKITLGSSYHVVSEEFITQNPQQQPIEQQQVEQQQVEQQQIEQQQQQIEQQPPLGDDQRGFDHPTKEQPLPPRDAQPATLGEEKRPPPLQQEPSREQQQPQQQQQQQQQILPSRETDLQQQQLTLVHQPQIQQQQEQQQQLAEQQTIDLSRQPQPKGLVQSIRQPNEQLDSNRGAKRYGSERFNGHQLQQQRAELALSSHDSNKGF